MQVILKKRIAGAFGNFGPGEIIILPEGQAKALIAAGIVERVIEETAAETPEIETATLPEPEKKVLRRGKQK